jgi:hypothetical protein
MDATSPWVAAQKRRVMLEASRKEKCAKLPMQSINQFDTQEN